MKTTCNSLIGVGLVAGLFIASTAIAADGKEMYTKNCSACHSAIPPKLGDKKAWEPLMRNGVDALTASVVKGKGTMPPNAGKPALAQDDIRAAVEYMLSQAK